MADAVHYRLITPEDGPALDALIAASPDAGTIGFTYDYQADLLAVSKAIASNLQGVVAVLNDTVIGMVFGDFLQVQWAGQLRQAAYLSNLRVHPDFRRRGVARGLADWGMAYVTEHLGPDAVVYGAVQEGNVSLALARRYQFQATDLIQGGVIPMRRTPPKPRPELIVRTATGTDLPAIAEGMNNFYREHNLWSPVTPASLQRLLDQQVARVRPNQLYVVTRGSHILGGLSLSDRTQLVRMRVARAPGYVQFLGSLLGVLPEDGVLRALTVRRVWLHRANWMPDAISGNSYATSCAVEATAWASLMTGATDWPTCSRCLSGCRWSKRATWYGPLDLLIQNVPPTASLELRVRTCTLCHPLSAICPLSPIPYCTFSLCMI